MTTPKPAGRVGVHRRGDRALAAAAIALGVLGFVLVAAGLVYGYRSTRLLENEVDWTGTLWLLWPAALVVVGVVVAVARPRILVGWGLLVAGFAIHVAVFAGAYSGWSRLSGSPAPLSEFVTWLGLIAGGVFALMAPLVLTRLPSGRPDTRMARLTSKVSWVLGGVLILWWAFGNEVLSINTMSADLVQTPGLPNPFALVHPSRAVTTRITTSLTYGLLACFGMSIILLLARRHRASAVERAQLRWLGLGVLALPVFVGLSVVVRLVAPTLGPVSDTVFLVIGLGAIPVSIAAAILKSGLFEIDRLISRTVVFSVVALVLAAVYAALTVLPYSLVVGVGAGDLPSWLVAASTLATAALFSPLRRRVQRIVDRRFNRSRYDAEQVVERFSTQVKEFTDLGEITSGLAVAVGGALQPVGVSVWLSAGRNDPVTSL